MKSKAIYLFCLLFTATVACAETQEYTVLGNQKIKAKVQNGMPLPAAKNGITVKGAGFAFGNGKLIWGFDFTTKKTPTKVVVEDVSGKSAIVLVEDSKPKLNGHDWTGNATPVALSKEESPWLFEPGDTTKVFRFTITLEGNPEPVVIYQPAVYTEQTKSQLQVMAR